MVELGGVADRLTTLSTYLVDARPNCLCRNVALLGTLGVGSSWPLQSDVFSENYSARPGSWES